MMILEKLKNITEKKYFWLIFGVSIVLLIAVLVFLFYHTKDENETKVEDAPLLVESIDEAVVEESFYVDIKDAVKKPGVYEVKAGTIVNDVINLAGGLKSNAYTKNINLSKKVSSEMVIYIYTKSEYNKLTTQEKESISKAESSNDESSVVASATITSSSTITNDSTTSNSDNSNPKNNTTVTDSNVNVITETETTTEEQQCENSTLSESTIEITEEEIADQSADITEEIKPDEPIYEPEQEMEEQPSSSISNDCENNPEVEDNNSTSETKLVNINTATIAELTTLSGIGESKAQKIIDYRTTNGLFKSIEDLKNVSGIGDATFEKIKTYLTV